ncbi:hypothetical protein ACTVBU_04970 [Sanguibacter sp. A246]|uniref:hypothetical protein n=1 Tax=Sanguibacter sp. A246 TaxID=3457326 RepID=UPI003FD870A2
MRSRLANVVFALELEHLLRASGSAARSFVAHPALARTPMHGIYPSRLTRLITSALARDRWALSALLTGVEFVAGPSG